MRAADSSSETGRRRLLLGLAAGIPLAEAVVLVALGLQSSLGLAAQSTALGPFGVFHDMRWLFVFHESVPAFAGGAVLALGGRAVLTALIVRSAWPAGSEPPRFPVLAAHALIASLVAAFLLSPWVTLLFGVALLPVSWAYLAAVPAALLTILLIHHGGIDRSWWRRLPPLRSMGWITLSFLVMSAVAVLIAGRPWPIVLPLVAAGGVFNAWAWRHGVRCIVARLPSRRPAPIPATVTAVVALLVTVVGGSWLGFEVADSGSEKAPVKPLPDAGARAVLVVPGFASDCCDEGLALQAAVPDLLVEQFSYLGIDWAMRPLPHDAAATDADLEHLAGLMARQVDALRDRTGGPVAVVAESEGTLVATVYLDRHPEAPVDRIMLLSPMVQPGRVNFPDPGQAGRGMVAGAQLRAMSGLIDTLAPFSISVDGPLGDSVRRDATTLHEAMLRDRPGIEEVAIIPVADAVASPPAADYPIEVLYLPGFHGGLRGRTDVRAMIVEWVRGQMPEGSEAWELVARLIADSASAWQVPSLGPYADAAAMGPGL